MGAEVADGLSRRTSRKQSDYMRPEVSAFTTAPLSSSYITDQS